MCSVLYAVPIPAYCVVFKPSACGAVGPRELYARYSRCIAAPRVVEVHISCDFVQVDFGPLFRVAPLPDLGRLF